MQAHLHDLRAEVDDPELAEQIAADWRSAPLPSADRALLEYAEKLTLSPRAMGAADVEALREAGFDDRAIHDLAQVVGYFNYVNRIADGLGTDPETFFGER